MKLSYVVLMIAIITLMPVVFAKSESVLDCYKLKNPVTFDGKWTIPEEWSDVSEIKLEHYKTFATYYPKTGVVYLRIKHDDSNLYFFMDDTTNTDPKGVPGTGWSFTGIFLDPNNQKSNLIKEDDSMQAVSWVGGTPQFSMLNGPSDVWKLENAKHSPVTVKYTMGTTEKSGVPHVVSEGVIPIGSGKTEIGISFLATNYGGAEANAWPTDFAEMDPSTWGTLKLLSQSYAEATPPSSTTTPPPTQTTALTSIPTLTPSQTPLTTATPTPTLGPTAAKPSLDTSTLAMLAGAIIVILVVAGVLITKRKKSQTSS